MRRLLGIPRTDPRKWARFPTRLLASLLLVALAAVGTYAAEPTPAPPVERALVLKIVRTRGSWGSGFATRYDGQPGVMTAWHVVPIPGESYAVEGSGVSRTLTFRRLGKPPAASDVAFAPCDVPPEWRVVRLGESPKVGQGVTAWGLPGVGGLVTSKGKVTRIDSGANVWIGANGRFFSLEAPVWSGMSGGPVVSDGGVFAVVSAGRTNGDGTIEAIVSEIPLP